MDCSPCKHVHCEISKKTTQVYHLASRGGKLACFIIFHVTIQTHHYFFWICSIEQLEDRERRENSGFTLRHVSPFHCFIFSSMLLPIPTFCLKVAIQREQGMRLTLSRSAVSGQFLYLVGPPVSQRFEECWLFGCICSKSRQKRVLWLQLCVLEAIVIIQHV